MEHRVLYLTLLEVVLFEGVKVFVQRSTSEVSCLVKIAEDDW